jgi:hypothetical protein
LSFRLWQSKFDGASSVGGETIRLGWKPATVGVENAPAAL